jgi:hypothetical protein
MKKTITSTFFFPLFDNQNHIVRRGWEALTWRASPTGRHKSDVKIDPFDE